MRCPTENGVVSYLKRSGVQGSEQLEFVRGRSRVQRVEVVPVVSPAEAELSLLFPELAIADIT